MSKRVPWLLCGVMVLAVMLSSCNMILSLFKSPGDETEEKSLSEKVVAEYQADLEGSSTSARALGSRAFATTLTSAQISALVASARNAIANADLADSTELDKIVEALIQGVAEQVKIYATSATPVDVSSALIVAAKSAVESMGAEGREGNVSASIGTTENAIAYVTARMVEIVDLNVPNAAVRDVVKAEVVREAVAALDAATTIGAGDIQNAVAQIVREVTAVVADDSAVFRTVVAAAAEASDGLDKASGLAAPISAQVAFSATEGLIEAVRNNNLNTDEVSGLTQILAAEISTAVGASVDDNNGISTQIQNAVSNAAGGDDPVTVTIDTGAINTALSETAPTAEAFVGTVTTSTAASVSVGTAGTVYLLSSSLPGGSFLDVDVEWRRLNDGPVPQPGTPWYIEVTGPGTFRYELMVTNQGGMKSATAVVTVISTFSPISADDFVDQGLSSVANSNIVGAKNAFAAALALDSANVEAKVWSAFLDLADIGTNADIVSLMRDNFGFSGYPDNLGLLASNLWFTETYYNGTSGFKKVASTSGLDEVFIRGTFSPAESGGTWVDYYDSGASYDCGTGSIDLSNAGPHYFKFYYDDADNRFEPNSTLNGLTVLPSGYDLYVRSYDIADLTDPFGLLPTVSAPSWAPYLANDRSMSGFGLCMLANIVNNNAAGLNSILDKIVSGVFGEELELVIATIKGLGDADSITIYPMIIEGLGGEPPTTGTGEAFDVVIHKRELLAFAAQLELLKGLFQYVNSYDLSYPIGSVFRFDYGNPNATGDADRDGVPNFIETALGNGIYGPLAIANNNLLDDRSQITRTASKTTFVTGLTDLLAAAIAIQTELEAVDSEYLAYIPDESTQWDEESETEITVTDEEIAENAAGMIDMGIGYATDLKTALEGDSILTVVIEEDDPETLDDETVSVDVVPSALFDSAVFSLGNLYVQNAAGTKLQRFVEVGSWEEVSDEYGTYMEFTPDPTTPFVAWPEGTQLTDLTGTGKFYRQIRVAADTTKIDDIWTNLSDDLWPAEYRYMPIGGEIGPHEYEDGDTVNPVVTTTAGVLADSDARIANWFIGYVN